MTREKAIQEWRGIDPAGVQEFQQRQAQSQNNLLKEKYLLTSNLYGKSLEEQKRLTTDKINYLDEQAYTPEQLKPFHNFYALLDSGDQNQQAEAQGLIKSGIEEGQQRFGKIDEKRTKEGFGRAKTLRSEINSLSKNFDTVSASYDRILAAKDTGAGDLNLIFNYMKMLDPNSVVRESEFRTAEHTAGIPERIRVYRDKILRGTRLGAEQRANFTEQSKSLYEVAERNYNQMTSSYKSIAERFGIKPEDIVIKRGSIGVGQEPEQGIGQKPGQPEEPKKPADDRYQELYNSPEFRNIPEQDRQLRILELLRKEGYKI